MERTLSFWSLSSLTSSLTKWLKNYRQKDLKQNDETIVIENFEFLSSLNYFDVLEYFSQTNALCSRKLIIFNNMTDVILKM